MLNPGPDGEIVLFYKDVLICSFPLNKEELIYSDYQEGANQLIVDSMRSNKNMREQIYAYRRYCNICWMKKLRCQEINPSDCEMFMASLLALVKLRILTEEESVYFAPKYRGNRAFVHKMIQLKSK